jgi:hypothetical protein
MTRWSERWLRLFLKPQDRESVPGDLLEEYALVVLPERGRWRADAWYLSQMARWAGATLAWGVALAASVVFRNELDWWLSPTQDFYARSMVSTVTAVAIFTASGALQGWRSRSVGAGALAGALTGAIAAVIITVVSLGQLAIRHDAHTMAMIAASGGLEEVFVLPFLVIVPGMCCACLGGTLGKMFAIITERQNTTPSAS